MIRKASDGIVQSIKQVRGAISYLIHKLTLFVTWSDTLHYYN